MKFQIRLFFALLFRDIIPRRSDFRPHLSHKFYFSIFKNVCECSFNVFTHLRFDDYEIVSITDIELFVQSPLQKPRYRIRYLHHVYMHVKHIYSEYTGVSHNKKQILKVPPVTGVNPFCPGGGA